MADFASTSAVIGSALHQCLEIRELVDMILWEFAQTFTIHEVDSKRVALSALALTSRCFLDPALDLIWETLLSLGQLIQCMPGDLWTKDANGQHVCLYLFNNTPKHTHQNSTFADPSLRRTGIKYTATLVESKTSDSRARRPILSIWTPSALWEFPYCNITSPYFRFLQKSSGTLWRRKRSRSFTLCWARVFG